jgi:hypothetical protein
VKTLNVPFVENPSDKCVPATIGMVLKYFMPDRRFAMEQIEKLCGYEQGMGTWKALSMLNMAKLGLRVHWVEDFDHGEFVQAPRTYLSKILNKEAYEWQVKHSDLEQEAERIRDYMDSGLPLESRKATIEDIKRFIDDGWLVHLEVNARTLSGKTGYDGHSILVIGYDDQEVVIHNPDGDSGNRPNQRIGWDLLCKAWEEFGGSFSLYAYTR